MGSSVLQDVGAALQHHEDLAYHFWSVRPRGC